MFAPAATPRAVLEKLQAALAAIVADPALRERFESQGCELVGGTTDALARVIRQDQAKWGRLIRDKHITVE